MGSFSYYFSTCFVIQLRYTQKELYEMVLAVADGSLEYEDMLKWILEHQA